MFYAVEVIQTSNRGTRFEQSRATGQYDYYRDPKVAAEQAKDRGVPVQVCEYAGQLDE